MGVVEGFGGLDAELGDGAEVLAGVRKWGARSWELEWTKDGDAVRYAGARGGVE